ncbi:hypothetical protein [Rugamonas rubra]|uniref:hypothetical protein n=1 Tax=Rugamonas rubra TaxID=758825 RepID=UPI000B84D31B|nr:hypothetical protein [Rugamonas rubra]
MFAEQRAPYRESFIEGGKIFDVFIYDAESLHYNLHAARHSWQTAVLDIVCSSITLPHENAISAYLRKSAERIRRSPPPVEDPRTFRILLTNLLRDLRLAQHRWDMQSLAIELYKILAGNEMREHGIGGHVRKHCRAALMTVAPGYCTQLDELFELTIRTSDAADFIRFGERTLEKSGGALVSDFMVPLSEGKRLPLRL